MKNIISISAFGFADTVLIGGSIMTYAESLPAVVIEDQKNKLFMYGADAIYERTGLGIEDGDTSSYTKRIPVALLWQELKWSKDLSDKQAAANLIAKYVIQLVCDKYQSYEQKHAAAAAATATTATAATASTTAAQTTPTAQAAPVTTITRSFIKANCQLVLSIPDNFDEDEQQCLLNAFSGFEISLLWRSIASLLGHFNTHVAFKAQAKSPSFAELQQHDKRSRLTVHVLYLGPDSIDLSTYELKASQEDNRYTLPIRLQPVYEDCATNLSFLHYALSFANSYINTLDKPLSYDHNMQLKKAFNQSLRSQVIYQFSEAWGRKIQIGSPHALRLPLNSANDAAQWCAVQALLSPDNQLNVKLSLNEVDGFYHDYEFAPTKECDMQLNKYEFVPLISIMLKRKIEADRAHYSTILNDNHFIDARSMHSTVLITGPMVANNAIADSIINKLKSNLALQGVPCYQIEWPTMAVGSYIYQKRANNEQETYLDRLRKLSMVSSTADLTEYHETVLINDKEEVSPIQTHERQESLVINKGSNSIELYVSSDPNFNDETIDKAITTSFKEQGISVQFAKLPFHSGLEAPKAEEVLVTVQQKALSGYVRFIIKPKGPSKVLPPRGELQVFDPAKKTDFTGTLPQPVLAYPPLAKPERLNFKKVSVFNDMHTIYRSDSVTSSQNLVYYDGKFCMQAVADNAMRRLQEDYKRSYPTLKDYCNRLNQNPRPSNRQGNLVERFIEELNDCLPLPLFHPFGHPEFNDIAILTANVMTICANNSTYYDKSTINKLQRRFFMFVPDRPEMMAECIRLTLRIIENNTTNFTNLKLLLENHPKCFSPKSKYFCFTEELAQRMSFGSIAILEELLNDVTPQSVFKQATVKGSKKLSVALSILLYSLLWRKKDPTFLTVPATIERIEGQLNSVLHQYRKLDRMVKSGEYARYNPKLHRDFMDRFQNFVHNKLEKQMPEVINYLWKKGSNPNIMAAITDLDEES